MPARPFDDSAANRVTGRQVFVVPHSSLIALEIFCRVPDGFPFRSLQTALGCLVSHASDHRSYFPLEQPPQTLFHPLMRLSFLGGLIEETPRHLPQSLHYVKEI